MYFMKQAFPVLDDMPDLEDQIERMEVDLHPPYLQYHEGEGDLEYRVYRRYD